MQFAIDPSKNRIHAKDAAKEVTYLCPICEKELSLKKGQVLAPHFAHYPNKRCIDSWKYDESGWQQNHQRAFPPEVQEVMVKCEGEIHRADILIGNTVILFQHEPITANFFYTKTNFFQKADKTVFWVFDIEASYAAKELRQNPKNRDFLFWDNPLPCLKKFVPQKSERVSVFLSISDRKLLKVEWAAPDASFTRIIHDAGFAPDLSSEDGIQQAAMNKAQRFDNLREKNRPWQKKAASTQSAPEKQWHICNATGTWHLDKCKTCEHNLVNEFRSKSKYHNGGLFFYCCYPRVVNPVVAKENEPSVAKVPSIWLKTGD